MRPILCLLAVAFVSAASPLAAQQPPYENPLAAEPPYYRVRYEASEKPGELIYPAGYTIWLPPGEETLRGVIVHQHGCGEGSCKSGQTGAYDLHWQALAKKHGCALLGPSYEQPEKADCRMWCDPRNGSDAAFQRALADLANASGHPELAAVPWAIWGHSGGGYWAGGMVLLHPDRVAAAWLRSGVPPVVAAEGKPEPYPVPEAASGVPMMANLGTKEGVTVKDGRFAGVWGGVKTFFETMRGKGARLGVAVDPLSSHDCGNQRYLAIPWFDACLAARLPENAGAPLNPMLAADGYLAPLYAGEGEIPTPVPAPDYAGVSESASWLPGEGIANAWAQYVKDTAVADPTPPPAPTNLRVDGNVLRWDAEADLESGISHFLIERDGEVIGKVPENAKNPFGRPLFQNLSYSDTPTQPLAEMKFTDPAAKSAKAHRYRIIAVNTAGLKSE